MLKKFLLPSTILLVLITIYSCEDNPVKPEAEPGRRDYSWTYYDLDTIVPYNSHYSMWGSSPDDVWTAGFGDCDGAILHFDGNTWNKLKYTGCVSPDVIHGASANSIWIGTSGSEIWQIKDEKAKRVFQDEINGFDGTYSGIGDISGYQENNMFAAGGVIHPDDGEWYGTILHFNGDNWKYLTKPNIKTQFFRIVNTINGEVFLQGVTDRNDGADFIGLFQYSNKKIATLYYERETSNTVFLSEVNNEAYFTFGKSICIWLNNKFVEVLNLDDQDFVWGGFFGRSLKDIFLSTSKGIGHYNGTEVKTLYPIERFVAINDVVLFENDVFIMGYKRGQKPIHRFILHGKLD